MLTNKLRNSNRKYKNGNRYFYINFNITNKEKWVQATDSEARTITYFPKYIIDKMEYIYSHSRFNEEYNTETMIRSWTEILNSNIEIETAKWNILEATIMQKSNKVIDTSIKLAIVKAILNKKKYTLGKLSFVYDGKTYTKFYYKDKTWIVLPKTATITFVAKKIKNIIEIYNRIIFNHKGN